MYRIVTISLVLYFACALVGGDTNKKYDASEVANKTCIEILHLRGYEAEEHYATTSDGYKVYLLRIVNPLVKEADAPLKRPVIFNHGLFESCSIWLINSRNIEPRFDTYTCSNQSLELESITRRVDSVNGPMLLANHAYDVWLMSMRGTEYSRDHVHLSWTQAEFWDYSLDDFALGDVPAVIEYVRDYTGASKVAYAGHSQATFSIFGLLATRPDFADIVEPVFAVAPVAYMHHTNSVGRPLFVTSLAAKEGTHGPFPRDPAKIRESLEKYCTSGRISLHYICKLLNAIIGGIGKNTLPGYYSHLPFTTSLKVLRHFGQLVTKEQFTRYDHDEKENLIRYRSKQAPLYDIANIRSRSICLFATLTDTLSHPEDVKLFKKQLRVPILKDVFINEHFNHFDLVTNVEARRYVFGPILQLLEEFEHRSGVCSIEFE